MDTPSSDYTPGGARPSSPVWARVALLLGSVFLCAGSVELGLRLTSSRPVEVCTKGFDQPVTSLFRHLDVAPYLTMWPNVNMVQRYFRVVDGDCVVDLEIPFQTNSQGFRDTEHTLFKSPGTYRVVVLGDSFTVGDGVLAEQAWPQVLQSRLRQRMGQPAARGAVSGVEVINTAVMSYGTMDEVVALQRWGLQYRPDAVVVGLYLNDAKPARGPQAAKKERSGERPAKRSTSNVLPTRLYTRPLYLMDWIEALVDVAKTNSET
ncbi:MAG: GDSL-type esterase/lipase family protein, partial [Myxococcota bacterium]|nr:GDSL-type esterase/lipase family protein [Myxococcota bacterium]